MVFFGGGILVDWCEERLGWGNYFEGIFRNIDIRLRDKLIFLSRMIGL